MSQREAISMEKNKGFYNNKKQHFGKDVEDLQWVRVDRKRSTKTGPKKLCGKENRRKITILKRPTNQVKLVHVRDLIEISNPFEVLNEDQPERASESPKRGG